MKYHTLKKILSCLAATAVVFCAFAFSNIAFAETSVSNEAELRAALAGGEVIVMTKDIKLASCLKTDSKSVTLDLNGYKLYRELGSASADGSVIEVSKNGSLTLKDSSHDTGTVSGGWATNGGGINNYGTLNIEGGRIIGNQADKNGGGINAAAGSKTTISNATVMKNDAKNGGGINIEVGAGIVNMSKAYVKNNTALYDGGGIQDLGGVVLDSCRITNNNSYGTGGGIYVNYNTVSVKGATVVKKNTSSNIYLRNGRMIDVAGELETGAEIGVSGETNNRTVTSGYSKYNNKEPSNYFFTDLEGGTVNFDSAKKEAAISSGYSLVEVYDSNNTVTKSETFFDPNNAWNKALSYAGSKGNVVFKLGTNWSHDKQLSISGDKKLTLDLNGFYILRTRDGEETSDGNVFSVSDGASLTIIDSRPKSKCFDGFKGGVIAGGCNDGDGGGIYVGEDASLYINGGILYQCFADGDGGGIYTDEDADKVDIRNFSILNCTADSVKADGGGIYSCINDLTVIDSCIEGCYSNDNGGAVCIDSDGSDDSGNTYFKNVVFGNNVAEDYAGALMVWSFDEDGDHIVFDSCNFISNSSNSSDGGAVYIDGNEDKTTLFNHCIFRQNESPDQGGAMTIYSDNVTLASCVFTENESVNEGGAVYVDSLYDINIKGRMIIKDNKSSKKSKNSNLCLQEGMASTARIYSGGLYSDSYIAVSTTDSKTDFARGIAEYQQKYFHAETGEIEFDETDYVQTSVLKSDETASLFGNGSIIIIICIAAVMIVAIAVVLFKKKKGDAQNG